MRLNTVGVTLIFSIMLQGSALAESPSSYEGRLLFISYCMLCHGTDGRGGGPLARKMEVEALVSYIRLLGHWVTGLAGSLDSRMLEKGAATHA
jgi:hypothetical protein